MFKKNDFKSIVSKSTTLSTFSTFLSRNKSAAVNVDQLAYIQCPILIKADDDSLSCLSEHHIATTSTVSSVNSERKSIGDINNNIKEFFRTEQNFINKLSKLSMVIKSCLDLYRHNSADGEFGDFIEGLTPEIKLEVNKWHKTLNNVQEIQLIHQTAIEDDIVSVSGIDTFLQTISSAIPAYGRFFSNSVDSDNKFIHKCLRRMNHLIEMDSFLFNEYMSELQVRIVRYPFMLKFMIPVCYDDAESIILSNLYEKTTEISHSLQDAFSSKKDKELFIAFMSKISNCPAALMKSNDAILGIFPVFKIPLIDDKLSVSLEEYKTSHTMVILKSGMLLLKTRVKTSYLSNVTEGIELLRKKALEASGYARYDECELAFNKDYRSFTLTSQELSKKHRDYFQFPLEYSEELRLLQSGFFNVLKQKYEVQQIDHYDNILTCYTTSKYAQSHIYHMSNGNRCKDPMGIILHKTGNNNFIMYKNGNPQSEINGKLERSTLLFI